MHGLGGSAGGVRHHAGSEQDGEAGAEDDEGAGSDGQSRGGEEDGLAPDRVGQLAKVTGEQHLSEIRSKG